jgi:hypothetical protein
MKNGSVPALEEDCPRVRLRGRGGEEEEEVFAEADAEGSSLFEDT